MDEQQKEYCRNCGTEIFPFSRKYSVSAGDYFCVKCAERLDREHLARTACALCGRKLEKGELKFVLPSSIFGEEKLHQVERVCCFQCHKKMGDRTRDTYDARQMRSALLDAIRKGIVKATIVKHEKKAGKKSSVEDGK